MRGNKASKGWTRPGWPWELEVLIFLAYLATVLVPMLFPDRPLPELKGVFLGAREDAVQEFRYGVWQQQEDLNWFLILTLFYMIHLVTGWHSARQFSTPLVHMITPTLMIMALYYRLLTQPVVPGKERILISGTPWEAATWVLGSVALTLVLARVRMRRYMLNFRRVTWDLTTPTRRDSTIWRLAPLITPIIYPLRQYHLFSEGMVVEGWFYSLSIPFHSLKSARVRQAGERIVSGLVLATSLHHMVELTLKDREMHMLLSPVDHEEFVRYIQKRLAGHREEVGHTQPILEDEAVHKVSRKTRQSAFAPGGIYERREPEHGPHSE